MEGNSDSQFRLGQIVRYTGADESWVKSGQVGYIRGQSDTHPHLWAVVTLTPDSGGILLEAAMLKGARYESLSPEELRQLWLIFAEEQETIANIIAGLEATLATLQDRLHKEQNWQEAVIDGKNKAVSYLTEVDSPA
jgi:hypothetical protein